VYYLRLVAAFIKLNIQSALAYRSDLVINILLNLMWLGWELIGLSIIFSKTDALGGWGPGELIALLGVFRLVNTLMQVVIWPNTEQFNASVRDGSLDYTLLKPVNSLFMVTFSKITIWRTWDFIVAVALVLVGIRMSGETITSAGLLKFMVLVLSGTLIIYSLWIVLIALTFWFTKFDNNVTILQALLDAGRYPATVYPAWLRVILTYLIPIAVATTVPLQALRGDLSLIQFGAYFSSGVVSFIAAYFVWKAGVRRYSGASA
jgi:ABC-2 type transport system permease protein